MFVYGQHPAPTHAIAHLSDPHLLATSLQYGVVDTVAHLEAALARLKQVELSPLALVFTGDLADKGEPEAYSRLRQVVEPVAAEFGAQVIWAMGNHDERAAYSQGLFGTASETPQDRVYDVAGLRIIVLDSTVPGYHHGNLEPAQLQWLADLLATPAPHGTLLAMHHPPIPVPMVPPAAIIELDDQQALAEVITDTDVRGVLGGHFHYTSWSTFAGVPVSVAAATCYAMDPAPDRRITSGVNGHQAFTMLHVYADQIVHSVVPIAEAEEITGHSSDLEPALQALSFAERREMLSKKDSEFYRTELGRAIE